MTINFQQISCITNAVMLSFEQIDEVEAPPASLVGYNTRIRHPGESLMALMCHKRVMPPRSAVVFTFHHQLNK